MFTKIRPLHLLLPINRLYHNSVYEMFGNQCLSKKLISYTVVPQNLFLITKVIFRITI